MILATIYVIGCLAVIVQITLNSNRQPEDLQSIMFNWLVLRETGNVR